LCLAIDVRCTLAVTDDLIQSWYIEPYQRELTRVGAPLKVRLSYRQEINLIIEDKFHKNFITLDHKWQNFLKYADKDSDAEIEPFKTKQLAMLIIWAIKDCFPLV